MVLRPFSQARAWRPAVVARLARTLGAAGRSSVTRLPSEFIVQAAASLLAVIYAKNAGAVAQFYEQVLGLVRAEESTSFVLLAGSGCELSVVAMPSHLAENFEVQSPPTPREETPIKLSFLVPDIEARRHAVLRAGGSLKPVEAAWSWRGHLHLDGLDPEGNVFQLRQAGGLRVAP